jgi:ubiquinone/menaquinone biosynthesis C-methylase UbiE
VLRRRDGGDDGLRRHGTSLLAGYRDGVLDRAAVVDGDVLLDVGTGDGLIGFAALERVGPGGRVIFSDVSADLLTECRCRAAADGLLEHCQFVHAGAEELRGIADRSVDVVTTRSVLIYVRRKQAAFAEFFRVLRPGGRLSIFEPVNSFSVRETEGEAGRTLFGLNLAAVGDLAAKVYRVYVDDLGADPMLDFDERDLLRWVRAAGFTGIELDFRAEVEVAYPMPTTDWEVLKKVAPNPLAPTYEEAIRQALTEDEQDRFEHHVRTALAAGPPGRRTLATAYLRAVRP